MRKNSYNPDIDALRALAVILVFLYHLNGIVPGGFIGVDIFFVISGFLISRILFNESNTINKYSGMKFFTSRLKRLLPAQLAIYFSVIVFGWIFLDPQLYLRLSQSLIWSLFSGSNFYYYYHSGYFDTSSVNNALLHTWSLAVEQQFYILLFLVAFFLKNSRHLVLILFISSVLSLILSIFWSFGNKDAAYFLLMSRVYELLLGFFVFQFGNRIKKIFYNKFLLFFAFVVIIFCSFVFDSEMPFPGYYALFPTLAASIILLHVVYCDNEYFKSDGLIVKLGRASYSIYLVHWPVIVFYRYYIFRDFNAFDILIIIFFTLFLSFLLYKFVEKKFRYSSYNKNIVLLLIGLLCAFVFFIIKTNGLAYRIFEERAINSGEYHEDYYGGGGISQGAYELGSGDKLSYILLGDSYSRQYVSSIQDLLVSKAYVSLSDACFFSEKYTSFISGKGRDSCFDRLNDVLKKIKKNPNTPIYIGINWGGYTNILVDKNGTRLKFSGNSYNDFVIKQIVDFQKLVNTKVYIIGSPPGLISGDQSLRSCIDRPLVVSGLCKGRLTSEISKANSRTLMLEFEKLSNDNIVFVDMTKPFCLKNKCEPILNGQYMYSDAHHLSKHGADVATSYYMNLFR
ncbi:acyltransferase [Vibrio cholerae]|nr:acyltransferase [Vibrio cholerae]